MAILKYKDPLTGEIKKVGYVSTPAEPVYAPSTLLASNWVDNTYSFESTYPASSYSVQVESLATTAEEFEVYGAAMMVGSATSNVLTALGEVPEVDLPVKLTIMPKNSKEVAVDYVMEAAKWVDNMYSFEDEYPSSMYTVSVEVSDKATAEEFEEFGNALVVGSTSENVAKALGDVPTMDIPVMLKVVGR